MEMDMANLRKQHGILLQFVKDLAMLSKYQDIELKIIMDNAEVNSGSYVEAWTTMQCRHILKLVGET